MKLKKMFFLILSSSCFLSFFSEDKISEKKEIQLKKNLIKTPEIYSSIQDDSKIHSQKSAPIYGVRNNLTQEIVTDFKIKKIVSLSKKVLKTQEDLVDYKDFMEDKKYFKKNFQILKNSYNLNFLENDFIVFLNLERISYIRDVFKNNHSKNNYSKNNQQDIFKQSISFVNYIPSNFLEMNSEQKKYFWGDKAELVFILEEYYPNIYSMLREIIVSRSILNFLSFVENKKEYLNRF